MTSSRLLNLATSTCRNRAPKGDRKAQCVCVHDLDGPSYPSPFNSGVVYLPFLFQQRLSGEDAQYNGIGPIRDRGVLIVLHGNSCTIATDIFNLKRIQIWNAKRAQVSVNLSKFKYPMIMHLLAPRMLIQSKDPHGWRSR